MASTLKVMLPPADVATAHSLTVTLPVEETNPDQTAPTPGVVCGVTKTFMLVRACATATVFCTHVPAVVAVFMRTMLCLAYSFGFRKSELLTLKVSDVNLLAGTVQLRDSKNGEARKVSLTPDAKNLLAARLADKSADDAVFTRGKKAVADFRGTWEKITKAAGCPGLLFHDLRRGAVRNMVRAGIPEVVCMKVSGHKTRNIFDRYNITSERDLADAARRIELSYRQAKNEAEQNAEQVKEVEQHDTIQ